MVPPLGKRLTAIVRSSMAAMVLVCWGSPARSEDTDQHLLHLSLEDLFTTKVKLVSRKAEKLSSAPAAVFVISGEDIRRSGVSSVAEALRLVPGLQVARIDANKWAVSSRGFNDRFANKLLVLIDGRSVYTPLFSGVQWEAQDVLLEDVERIEVVRGPGATLWGANAVNGVINIITKSSSKTEGSLVAAGSGTEQRGSVRLRHGGRFDEDTSYRVYAKYFDRDESASASGGEADDNWHSTRSGFRIDRTHGRTDQLTLQGDIYANSLSQSSTVAVLDSPFVEAASEVVDLSGANVLGRWERRFSSASDLSLQLYYDRTVRSEIVHGETRNTLDMDFQHRFSLGLRQELMWGGGYRYSGDDIDNTFSISIAPRSSRTHLFNAFVQDDAEIIPNRIRAILGAKFEHNDFTGLEIQPNARFLLTLGRRQTVWGAASRAVRTPSRADDGLRSIVGAVPTRLLPEGAPPTFLEARGSRRFKSETIHAFELGYRLLSPERYAIDLTTFYNRYDNLRNFELDPSVGTESGDYSTLPFVFNNRADGRTVGFEASADWELAPWWRLHTTYSYLDMELNLAGDDGSMAARTEGTDPSNQLRLRNQLELKRQWQLDAVVRYTDSLKGLDIKDFWELDLRLGWTVTEHLDLAFAGRNLLHKHHAEFLPLLINSVPAETERSLFAILTWRG